MRNEEEKFTVESQRYIPRRPFSNRILGQTRESLDYKKITRFEEYRKKENLSETKQRHPGEEKTFKELSYGRPTLGSLETYKRWELVDAQRDKSKDCILEEKDMRPGLRRVLPTEQCAACGRKAHFMCGACKAEHY
jgi:hypothetical protein